MAAYESLHEYYLHQHRNLVNYLELCLIHPDPELVHELRLSIKKLRAFNKLAEHLNWKEIDEHTNIKGQVKKLYNLAGLLRDTQVQLELLVRFSEQTEILFPEFDLWLKKLEKKQIQRFDKKPQHVVSQPTAQNKYQKIGDLLALADNETILNCASEVLTDLYSTARDLSAGNINVRNMHRIRTITKQMRYIINTMVHNYRDFKFDEVSVDLLREIEAAAGNWHDNLVRVELLDKFLSKMKFIDDSGKFKYQKFSIACKSELDIAFNEATLIVKKALYSEIQNSDI